MFQVGSTFIEHWETDRYPDFVALGSSDQKTIMEAICTVKKASFGGVDCVGGDDTATGTVRHFSCRLSLPANEVSGASWVVVSSLCVCGVGARRYSHLVEGG